MKFIKLTFAAAILAVSTLAAAWSPAGPVRVIIPAPAGSLHDKAFKTIQPELERLVGVPVVIEYKPGAAGIIGANTLLNYPADGHHVLINGSLSQATSKISSPDVTNWDFAKDFTYVATFASTTIVMVTTKDNNLVKFDSYLSAIKSGKTVKYGITFPNQEALVRLIYKRTNSDINRAVFVKYTDPAQAMVDVVNGSVDIFVGAVPATVPLYKSGKIDYIASSAIKPVDGLETVPTINSRLVGITQSSDVMLSLKSGSPAGAAEWWNQVVSKSATSPTSLTLRKNSFMYLDTATLGIRESNQLMSDMNELWAPIYIEMLKK